MGLLRLLVPEINRLAPHAAERAYVTGLEFSPWASRIRYQGGELTVERPISDSGRFHIPWQIEGRGEFTLSTATLMERDRPYHLPVELARGEIYQLRQQIVDWQAIGLNVPESLHAGMREAVRRFAEAATLQHDPEAAAVQAGRALTAAFDVGEFLVSCYVDQALTVRHRNDQKLPTLLGVHLGSDAPSAATGKQLSKFCNAATVPMLWRDVESGEGKYNWDAYDAQVKWCNDHGVKPVAGPLLRLDAGGVPDWLYLWEGDFDSLLSFVSDYVETAVLRYRGQVSMWQCAARVNVADVLGLKEVEKLRLAIRAVEIVRKLDPETPAIIQFDQPWAEYLRIKDRDLSPLRFADELLRTGLELAGIGLEINVGYYPGGSYCRDRLDFNRLVDLWSLLGLPLFVWLTVPSDQAADPHARASGLPQATALPGGWTPEHQRNWVKRYLPLLLTKPIVQGIFWNQWSDARPHEWPHGGLVGVNGRLKPAFQTLVDLRREHLT